MKQANTHLTAMALCLVCINLMWVGCETESVAEQKVQISPESAQISKDQSIELIASGGFDYTWSLSDSGIGTLSTRSGPRTFYTSRLAATNVTTKILQQVITVNSSISTAGGTTNTPDSVLEQSAESYIQHL